MRTIASLIQTDRHRHKGMCNTQALRDIYRDRQRKSQRERVRREKGGWGGLVGEARNNLAKQTRGSI